MELGSLGRIIGTGIWLSVLWFELYTIGGETVL